MRGNPSAGSRRACPYTSAGSVYGQRRTEALPQVVKAGWAAPVRRTCPVARQAVTPQAHLHCAVRSAVQVCGVIELAEMHQPLAEGNHRSLAARQPPPDRCDNPTINLKG
ncbi:MAG: hypothetical protein ROW48_12985 [Bellilinea sp.]